MRPPLKLLIVDDDSVYRKLVRRYIAAADFQATIIEASTAREAQEALERESVDCAVVDHNLPDMNGVELIEAFAGGGTGPPAILLTGSGSERVAVRALKSGAADYIVKEDADAAGLNAAIVNAIRSKADELRKQEKSRLLEVQAFTDRLTGLGNRRAFESIAPEALAAALQANRPIGFIMLDLDRFKPVNDRLGHAAGDTVLQQVGLRINHSLRRSDQAFRVGGDEFAVVVQSDVDGSAIEKLCDRIRQSIICPIDVGGEGISVGVSTGTAIAPDDGELLATLLNEADQRMYRAKEAGR